MKLFGSLRELVAAVFRKDSQEITVRPNQATTYTAARDVQLPPGDSDHALVSADSTQTLTNKTIDGDDNTVQDLAISSLKTEAGDANEVLVRDGSGAVVSAALVNANVDAAAGIVYSKLDLSDSIDNADINSAAAIDASKIADGSVSSTEFQYLDGVTSDIQPQLDAKLDDFTGTTDNVLIRTDGTGGNAVQESGIVVDDSDNMSGVADLDLATLTSTELGSDPTTPASGKRSLYPKSDGWYDIDDAGTAVKFTTTAASAVTSMIRLAGASGHGSTGTRIRVFTSTPIESVGSDITYTSDSVNGDYFTINQDGVYSMTYGDTNGGGAAYIGITKNAPSLTASIEDVGAANRLTFARHVSAEEQESVTVAVRLSNGDVIRAHTNGAPNETSQRAHFIITQVAKF